MNARPLSSRSEEPDLLLLAHMTAVGMFELREDERDSDDNMRYMPCGARRMNLPCTRAPGRAGTAAAAGWLFSASLLLVRPACASHRELLTRGQGIGARQGTAAAAG